MINPLSIREAYENIVQRLAAVSETAHLDAQVLLAHIMGVNRTWIIAHPEEKLTIDQYNELERLLSRLQQGEPLPYVLGHWEFYGLDFKVAPSVLIPRPETELLVENALKWLREHPSRRIGIYVGSGSGCIAAALTFNIPDLKMVASDISFWALKLARENLDTLGVAERVYTVQSDLLTAFARTSFDMICANLPYIETNTLKSLDVSRYEPTSALDGGVDGIAIISRLFELAPGRLSPGGCMLMEIESTHGETVYKLAKSAFPRAKVSLLQDLTGHDRLLHIKSE